MGKCHCVDTEGLIVLSDTTLYIECCDDIYECIKKGKPCCIVVHDYGRDITLHDCTIENKVITYARKCITGRNIK